MKNKTAHSFTSSQIELLETLKFNDAQVLANEFMMIHDMALYHSDLPIDEKEKAALFQLKQLSEILRSMAEK